MGWNNGNETICFEKKQKKQAEEYRKLGMTEEQIQTMYEFDMEQYHIERREMMHTQPILPFDFDENEDDEEKLSLYRKYLEQFSTTIESDVNEDNGPNPTASPRRPDAAPARRAHEPVSLRSATLHSGKQVRISLP